MNGTRFKMVLFINTLLVARVSMSHSLLNLDRLHISFRIMDNYLSIYPPHVRRFKLVIPLYRYIKILFGVEMSLAPTEVWYSYRTSVS